MMTINARRAEYLETTRAARDYEQSRLWLFASEAWTDAAKKATSLTERLWCQAKAADAKENVTGNRE